MEEKQGNTQPNNPLHGIKLATMLEELISEYGFSSLAEITGFKAFDNNPTYKSSLKFLRTTPWARERFEQIYLTWITKYKEGK